MATIKSIQEYRQLQNKRIVELRKIKRRGPITTAKFMVAQLRSMCPVGNISHPDYPPMYQTIKRNKNEVRLGGTNPNTGFPYVHWVNATPGMGMETVNLFGRGKKVSYGQTHHTGTPGFYWVAQHRARSFNRDAMITATRKVLSGTF